MAETKLRSALENKILADTKLSKPQISKIIQPVDLFIL